MAHTMREREEREVDNKEREVAVRGSMRAGRE